MNQEKGKKKLVTISFGSINKSQLKLKNRRGKVSRTGASTEGRVRAHGRHHKHR